MIIEHDKFRWIHPIYQFKINSGQLFTDIHPHNLENFFTVFKFLPGFYKDYVFKMENLINVYENSLHFMVKVDKIFETNNKNQNRY